MPRRALAVAATAAFFCSLTTAASAQPRTERLRAVLGPHATTTKYSKLRSNPEREFEVFAFVNGRELKRYALFDTFSLTFQGRGASVVVTTPRKRGRVKFQLANYSGRTLRVTLRYRDKSANCCQRRRPGG